MEIFLKLEDIIFLVMHAPEVEYIFHKCLPANLIDQKKKVRQLMLIKIIYRTKASIQLNQHVNLCMEILYLFDITY